MRWSRYFLQTVREVPGDADAISHILLSRAGMIRRLAAGIYSLTPLGLRSHRKTEQIVREEIDRAGGLEVELPILQPRELWEESGRWARYVKEEILFHLKDRKDGEYCLAPTAEEAVTTMVRSGVTSYRQLPVTLYQIRTKFRDEIRPRFGLMRGREFLMYDGYSFDVDAEGLDRSYKAQDAAYRQVFRRCGLDFTVVQADSGAIGGTASEEFMVLADTGEDAVVRCPACGYGANLEKAETGARPAPWKDETETPMVEVETPGKGGIDDVVEFLGITASRMIKCLVYETERGFIVALLRGDLEVNEVALKNMLQVDHLALAAEDKVEKATGAPVGYVGPHKLPAQAVRIVGDHSIRDAVNAVTGAGRRDWHVAGFVQRRDAKVEAWGSFAQARAGDPCPRCGKPLDIARGHRGRPHLQARDEVLDGARLHVHRREGGDPSRRHGHVRDRRRSHDGRGDRAAPRRRRDRVAPRDRALRDRARLAEPVGRDDPARGRRSVRGAAGCRARRLLRRSRRASRRQVQGRGPDRLPDPRQRRGPGAQGRQSRDREAPGQEHDQRRDRRGARGGEGHAGRTRRR